MTAQPSAPVGLEPVLEPDLPICDPHHHLWDRPQSRYRLEEYIADISSGHNIVSSVYVECESMYLDQGPEAFRPVGETRFANMAAKTAAAEFDRPGICAGIVSFADLSLGQAVGAVLDAHLQASPRFRGIRHCTAWDPDDTIYNAHTNPAEKLLENEKFQEGFSELAKRGLTFDAWIFHRQIPDVISLARAFPETPIILDHLGGPLGIGPYAGRRETVLAEWKASMTKLAEHPNVSVKLGGICMPLNGWGLHRKQEPATSNEIAALTRDYYLHAINCFGVSRCMFESNFPADRPSLSYRVLWNALKRLAAGFTPQEKAALFHDNAVRTYKL